MLFDLYLLLPKILYSSAQIQVFLYLRREMSGCIRDESTVNFWPARCQESSSDAKLWKCNMLPLLPLLMIRTISCAGKSQLSISYRKERRGWKRFTCGAIGQMWWNKCYSFPKMCLRGGGKKGKLSLIVNHKPNEGWFYGVRNTKID